ncbi:TPA: hypothetical protein ACQQH4_000949 [Pseudomonas aeruginosa]
MSSTQHQLIEQCATRLRGIVEALDNIHDSTPQRWSADLDDVHSSAESLLALIKDQAPARSEASFEEWLANELEGEDGQPVPAAVCDIALARRAFNHWPKLEQPAKVGGVRFSAGVSSRLVVEAAQRLYEFESTPEQEAERIERLQAFREQLDPLNLAPHAKAFNEAPAEALKSEQAEAERPEVVAWRYGFSGGIVSDKACLDEWKSGGEYQSLMTVAQHERIVGALRFERQQTDRAFTACINERDAALARVAELETKLAELERQEPVAFVQSLPVRGHQPCKPKSDRENGYTLPLYAAPVAQAQHSVPDGAADLCRFLAKLYCELDGLRYSTAKLPAEQIADALIFKWPVLQGARNQLNIKRISEQPYDESKLHSAIAAMLAAAPGKEAPQAWIDVQAERRRQIEVEGYHGFRDSHYINYELSKAARAYIEVSWHALSGGLPCKKPESWPWMAGFKWADGRTMLVKAGALILAEIERLDRAAASQGGPSDA